MRSTILYPGVESQTHLERFGSLLGNAFEVLEAADEASARVRLLIDGRPTDEILASHPHLEAVIVPFAGVPPATLEVMRRHRDVALFNLHHNAADTAEHAMALLLAAARRVLPWDRLMREGDWSPRYTDSQGMRLEGRRALVLGYGAIGRRIARACLAFGMHVTAIRRSQEREETIDDVTILPPDSLGEALASCDALLIALPLTPETEGLIGKNELLAMPRGAVLVNVARGGVVDEAALYEALAAGRLRAAGLDVWWRYPAEEDLTATYPSHLPFWEHQNVVMTPHVAGTSDDTESHRVEALAELILAIERDGAKDNRVDVDRGY